MNVADVERAIDDMIGIMLSFDSGDVDYQETRTFVARPMTRFHIERLLIPAVVGEGFVVESLTVDGVEQFVGIGEVPALMFSEAMAFQLPELSFDPVKPGGTIALRVRRVERVEDHVGPTARWFLRLPAVGRAAKFLVPKLAEPNKRFFACVRGKAG